MATISEAIQSQMDARQQLESERRKLAQSKQEAERMKAPRRSLEFQQQYIRTGQIPIGKVEQFSAQQKASQQKALAEIGVAESQLNVFGQQIEQQDKQERAYKEIQQLAKESGTAIRYTSQVGDALRNLSAATGMSIQEAKNYYEGLVESGGLYQQAAYDIGFEEQRKTGLQPVYSNGKLVGYRDVIEGKSVPLSSFGDYASKLPEKRVKEFEKAGLIEIKKQQIKEEKELPSYEELKPQLSTIEAVKYSPWYTLTGAKERLGELRSKEKYAIISGVATPIVSTIEFGYGLATQPVSTTKGLFGSFKETGRKIITGEGFPEIGRTIAQEPGYAFGRTIGEIGTAYLTGKTAAFTTEKISIAAFRISPKYRSITKLSTGEEIIGNIPSSVSKGSEIKLKIAEPLESPRMKLTPKQQVQIAGKDIIAVSAAQDFFGKILKREVRIEKPVPIGGSEIERSLFFDPSGKIRVSRILQNEFKKPSFVDILSEEISFKKPRKQVLFIEKAPVEKFPPYLNKVKSKIERNIPLTPIESKQLLEWQLKPSKQLKPIGKLKSTGIPTSEPEVTLAPKEILVKKRIAARIIYKGKPVTIIESQIKDMRKETSGLFKSSLRTKKISGELQKRLAKEKGSDFYYAQKNRLYIPKESISTIGLSKLPIEKYKSKIIYKQQLYKLGRYIKPSYIAIYKKQLDYKGTTINKYQKPKYKKISYNKKVTFNYKYKKDLVRKQVYQSTFYIKLNLAKLTRRQIATKIGKKRKLITKQKRIFKTKYTPSVGASILDIRARGKPRQVAGGYFAGFRPILLKSSKYNKIYGIKK